MQLNLLYQYLLDICTVTLVKRTDENVHLVLHKMKH